MHDYFSFQNLFQTVQNIDNLSLQEDMERDEQK